jgi:osmotically-inducible protein OsmY
MHMHLLGATAVAATLALLGASMPARADDPGAFYRMAMSEAAADAAIKGKVEAALATERSLHGLDILVDVKGGVILLSGQVDSAGQRQTAGRLATGVSGVKKVMNELMVMREG